MSNNNIEKSKVVTSNQKISIGIFSSSSDIGSKLQERVWRAKKILEDNNLIVNLGNLWDKSIGYTTALPKERAEEFNSLIDSNDVLMSMIGGMNSSSILEYIDYGKIKQRKTKIVGYSDTTAILLAIYAKTGLPVYYGPALLPSFDEQEYISDWNISSLNKYVIENSVGEIVNPPYWTQEKLDWFKHRDGYGVKVKQLSENQLYSVNDGIVSGRLIGGNLSTMVSIYGTEYMPEINKGDILFFEDSNKSIDECERNFAFLKNSKILDKVSAIIIGKCEGFNAMNSNETYESLFLKFLDHKIPVLMNYDCSHCQPMNVLKIGSKIKLDTLEKKIYFLD